MGKYDYQHAGNPEPACNGYFEMFAEQGMMTWQDDCANRRRQLKKLRVLVEDSNGSDSDGSVVLAIGMLIIGADCICHIRKLSIRIV